MPDGVGHRQNRQHEGERDSEQPDADTGKRRGQNSAAATAKHQPEVSDKLCGKAIGQCHLFFLSGLQGNETTTSLRRKRPGRQSDDRGVAETQTARRDRARPPDYFPKLKRRKTRDVSASPPPAQSAPMPIRSLKKTKSAPTSPVVSSPMSPP